MGDDGFGGFGDGPMGDLGGETGDDGTGPGLGLGDASFGQEGANDGVIGLPAVDVTGKSIASPSFFGDNTSLSDLGMMFADESNFGQSQSFSNPDNMPIDDDGILGKFGKQALSMAFNMALGKLGISPIGQAVGKTAMNAFNAPTQQAETDAVGKGFMGMMQGVMGPVGMGLGLANQGLNAMSQAGMIGQPNTNADGSPAPAGTTGASSMGTNGIGGQDILGGLASLYGYNRANSAANDQINSLSGMYGQDSPYAQMLRQQLQRSDAAGGRRSNVGGREVELQARLAEMASRNAPAIGQLRQGQNQMRAQGLAQLINFMNKSGATQGIQNGLQGMFNQGNGQQFDSSYGPALDPYGAGSGWGQDTFSNMGQDYFGG